MTDWRERSAAELGRAIGRGEIDPRELAEAYFEAIEQHPYGARIYARLTHQRARDEAAAAADRQRRSSRNGPLDGVPVSWKDMYDTAGTATEAGTRMLAGRIPDTDAVAVRRGAEAGLVCLGKTHLSELAFSGLGVNPCTATPPNRHDPDRAPGGSSSGAAASVAFGLAAAAVGSDTGGSVRIPAAWNDLVGLKTTWGLVPMAGAVPLARSLDTAGPLCRTVEDAALMHEVLAGERVDLEGAELADEPLLVAESVVLENLDPEVENGFEDAIARLAAAGAAVSRGPVPEFTETGRVAKEISAIVNTEGWREWGAVIEAHPGAMFPQIERRFRSGASGSAERDAEALAAYRRISNALVDRIERTGLIALPTTASYPAKVADLLADEDYYVERNLAGLRNTRIGNLLGLAAITVPTGAPAVGLMLYGRPGDEARLLRAASAIDRALAG